MKRKAQPRKTAALTQQGVLFNSGLHRAGFALEVFQYQDLAPNVGPSFVARAPRQLLLLAPSLSSRRAATMLAVMLTMMLSTGHGCQPWGKGRKDDCPPWLGHLQGGGLVAAAASPLLAWA